MQIGIYVLSLTYASLHVFRRHESIIAKTPVFSWDVCTLASITDVRIVFTLINIYRGKSDSNTLPLCNATNHHHGEQAF